MASKSFFIVTDFSGYTKFLNMPHENSNEGFAKFFKPHG